MQRLSLFALVLAVCLALSSAFVPAPRVLKPVARVSSLFGVARVCVWVCPRVGRPLPAVGQGRPGPALLPSPAQPIGRLPSVYVRTGRLTASHPYAPPKNTHKK